MNFNVYLNFLFNGQLRGKTRNRNSSLFNDHITNIILAKIERL